MDLRIRDVATMGGQLVVQFPPGREDARAGEFADASQLEAPDFERFR
jgi:hypothetical protein